MTTGKSACLSLFYWDQGDEAENKVFIKKSE